MDVFVGRLMSSPVRSVTPDAPVRDAAETLIEHDIGSLVVVDTDNHLEGILTSTDFVRITADAAAVEETTVAAYMTTDVITATANDDIRDVADTMVERGFHHVPVVDDEEGVIGILTTTDLTAYLSQSGTIHSS